MLSPNTVRPNALCLCRCILYHYRRGHDPVSPKGLYPLGGKPGLHLSEVCAYNGPMRFNGVDSDVTLEDVDCDGCDRTFAQTDGVAYTRSYGDDVQWVCILCGHLNEIVREYL
jgi:hypothetical protein